MQERTQLITVEQFRQLARPTSKHLDEREVSTFIRECEDTFIIPAIGWGNFKSSIGLSVWSSTFDDSFVPDLFLDGGEWSKEETDENGEKFDKLYFCNGAKKALAYFVYAKLLRSDGTIVSRSGAMRHNDDYSDHINEPQLRQYNDVMNLAERYLSECLQYLKIHKKSRQISPVRGTRARVHAIGG